MQQLLTPEDVEKEYGLSATYCRRLLYQRQLRPVKVGHTFHVHRNDIETWVLNSYVPPGSRGSSLAIYVRDIYQERRRMWELSDAQKTSPDNSKLPYEVWQRVIQFLPLVPYVAGRRLGKRLRLLGMEMVDAVQEGNLSLIRAAELYKDNGKATFMTYAFACIRYGLLNATAEHSDVIRRPRHVSRKFIWQNYYQPDVYRGVGDFATVPLDTIENTSEEPVIEEEVSQSGPDSMTEKDQLTAKIQTVGQMLKAREWQILVLRYGLMDGTPHTLNEVGQIFGVGKERIRQIEAKALRKLRHPSRKKHLWPFIENATAYLSHGAFMRHLRELEDSQRLEEEHNKKKKEVEDLKRTLPRLYTNKSYPKFVQELEVAGFYPMWSHQDQMDLPAVECTSLGHAQKVMAATSVKCRIVKQFRHWGWEQDNVDIVVIPHAKPILREDLEEDLEQII